MKTFKDLKNLRKKRKMHLTFQSENLAVPEIHTNESEEKDDNSQETSGIYYDNLAMPEIHFSHKKNDK